MTAKTDQFKKTVRDFYRQHGRKLPWRCLESGGFFDPYKILVSEIMLQQTQVARVIPKYQAFLEQFPDIDTLAYSALSDVLSVWSGLGYNRRAKYLHDAAKQLVSKQTPWAMEDLVACRGIGTNTAAAVVAYAYNQPIVFIETNIRTVYIHHFFAMPGSPKIPRFQGELARAKAVLSERKVSEDTLKEEKLFAAEIIRSGAQGDLGEPGIGPHPIADRQIWELVSQTLDRANPREFYWALMDYGTYIKTSIGNTSRLSKHYSKQSRFEGSPRQIRGQILRLLIKNPLTSAQLESEIADERLQKIIIDLETENLIKLSGVRYFLAS